MKKNILVIAALASLLAYSCRKERTCECTTTTTRVRTGNNAGTTTSNSTEKITVEKQKKREFLYATNCFSSSGSDEPVSGGTGTSAFTIETSYQKKCELK